MNIHARPGSRVKFIGYISGDNYYDSLETKKAKLKVGNIYTIKGIDVSTWKSYVYLNGYRTGFNTIMFEDYTTIDEIKEICSTLGEEKFHQ